MKMKTPVIWDRHPDLNKMIDKSIREQAEVISIELGGQSFVSSPDVTVNTAKDALIDTEILPAGASPINLENIPKLAREFTAHIDGKQEDGPMTKYFAKKWAVLKVENPGLFNTLNDGGQGAPAVGKSSAPAGTKWVLNIAGGPQPAIGRGELLFGLLHGLEAGDGGPEDADLKLGNLEYHIKYFKDTGKAIKGPTRSQSSVYAKQIFSGSPTDSPLFAFIRESVTKIFGGDGTYNAAVEGIKIPGDLVSNPPDIPKIKALIAWYVARIAKMSLVRGERDGEKFIVMIVGEGNFQVDPLSATSLRLPPYPLSQQSNGRISYNIQVGGPAQTAAAQFPSLIEATLDTVVQEILDIESGTSTLEAREIVDIQSVIKADTALPYSAPLKAALKSAYENRENARSYAIGSDVTGVNAAWENLLKPLDASSWPARGYAFIEFLENPDISSSAKKYVLKNIIDPAVTRFLSNLSKLQSTTSVEGVDDMVRILEENVSRSTLLVKSVNRILAVDKILQEELTRTDKKDIDRMIAKRIEKDRAEQKRLFKKNLEEELKSSKFQKIILEMAKDEMGRELKGKQLEGAVLEITKKVIKKLYRELSYSYNPVIDRIKL